YLTINLERLPYFDVLQIIARGNPRRLAERGVVEIHPRARLAAVGQRGVGLFPTVETAIGIVVAVALDVVERREHGGRIRHLVDLPPDPAFRGRHDRRVEAEVEERAA